MEDCDSERGKRRIIGNDNHGGDDSCYGLSSLPDPILADILSLLPLKSAVSSAVLSRRWRFIWHQLTAIRHCSLSIPDFFTIIFPKLMSSEIDAFEIRDSFIPPPHAIARFQIWISKVCLRRLKKFVLDFGNREPFRSLTLPACVFECKTLEFLVLGNGCHFKLPENEIRLPNLRKLHISLRYENLRMMKPLFESCPLLEDLWVRIEWVDNYGLSIYITCQNLKRLRLSTMKRNNSRFSIDAPKLEHFQVEGPNLLKYSFVKSPRFLVKAKFYIWPDVQVANWGFLQFFHSLKTLSFSGEMFAPVYYMIDGPIFYSLTKFKMDLMRIPACWNPLMHFLSSCPNLQVLVMTRVGDFEWGKANWFQLVGCLPTCLSTNVKTIKVRNLRGKESELELVSFVLSAAKVLETLDVSVVDSENVAEELGFCRKLFMFPRTSSSC